MRAFLVAAALVLSGCASTSEPEPGPDPAGAVLAPAPSVAASASTLSPFGISATGAAIPVIVLGDGPDTTLFVASIHGDEPAGTPLLFQLHSFLASRPELLRGRRVVLVPQANPDGFAEGTRENAVGVDLNRDLPSDNRREAATPLQAETQALMAVIERYPPDRVVSIHQPLRCVDYDGEAAELARAMSAACGLPVRKLGARTGSLGSYLGKDRGIPVITLELPGHAQNLDARRLWDRYGDALVVAVRGASS